MSYFVPSGEAQPSQVIPERLERINNMQLGEGNHASIEHGACVMEAVAYITDSTFTHRPPCVCPVLTEFLVRWNDGLKNPERTELLKPLIPRLVGTHDALGHLSSRRSLMVYDWLLHTYLPFVLSKIEHDSSLFHYWTAPTQKELRYEIVAESLSNLNTLNLKLRRVYDEMLWPLIQYQNGGSKTGLSIIDAATSSFRFSTAGIVSGIPVPGAVNTDFTPLVLQPNAHMNLALEHAVRAMVLNRVMQLQARKDRGELRGSVVDRNSLSSSLRGARQHLKRSAQQLVLDMTALTP